MYASDPLLHALQRDWILDCVIVVRERSRWQIDEGLKDLKATSVRSVRVTLIVRADNSLWLFVLDDPLHDLVLSLHKGLAHQFCIYVGRLPFT